MYVLRRRDKPWDIVLLCWSCSAYNEMCSTHKHLVVVVVVPFISDRDRVTMYKSFWLIHFFILPFSRSPLICVFPIAHVYECACSRNRIGIVDSWDQKKNEIFNQNLKETEFLRRKNKRNANKRWNIGNVKRTNCFIVNKSMSTSHVTHKHTIRFQCYRCQQQVSGVKIFRNPQRALSYVLWEQSSTHSLSLHRSVYSKINKWKMMKIVCFIGFAGIVRSQYKQ